MFLIFRWVRRAIYVIVLALVVYLLVNSVQVVLASRNTVPAANVTPAGAIVVVGSATGPSATVPSADLKARCDLAVAMVEAGKAKIVIVTGASSGRGDPTEASVARNYLRAKGVAHIEMVPISGIPSQLGFVAGILPDSAHARVVVVSDPLQVKWLSEVASAEGLNAQVMGAPVAKGSFWGDVGVLWGQTVAVALGRIIGFKNTGSIGG